MLRYSSNHIRYRRLIVQINQMSNKVEYITRLFQKTSNKAIEHYCLTRLWHKLDDDEIKFIPQQYVNRHSDKYALTDVYLPQFDMHIEVNESAHYDSEEKIKEDQIRKNEIEKNTGHKVRVIDCRGSLENIHHQIDGIISEIRHELALQKESNTFKPWQPDVESDPDHWKKVGMIKTADEISFRNIEDICKLFDADFKKTKRGFLRRGGIYHPNSKEYLLWWPSEINRRGWSNTLSQDELEIVETHKDDTIKAQHFQEHVNSPQKRIVFFHHTDVLGLTSYKYKGVFVYDKLKSSATTGIVWKKVEDELNINVGPV